MKINFDLALIIYKVVLIVEILFIALNCLWVLFVEFMFIIKNSVIDIVILKKAKSLLFFGFLAAWCMAAMIFIGEKMLHGFSTVYFAKFMFIAGILLLTISVFSAITAIVAWGRVIQEQSDVYVFKKLMWAGYAAALILWLLSWVLLHHT